MITVPGFLKNVFEITDMEVNIPMKKEYPPIGPGKKPIFKYVAPSTSVLVVVKTEEIELVIGRKVSEQVLNNVLGFGIKSKKYLKLSLCEGLSNLQSADRMVALCNDILREQQGIVEEYLLPELDSDEENDYNGQ